MIQFDEHISQNGLVQPPTSYVMYYIDMNFVICNIFSPPLIQASWVALHVGVFFSKSIKAMSPL